MSKITDLILNRTKYTKCGCGSELLLIEYDHELDIADICIFENQSSFRNKMGLLSRFRYAIKVLLSGPYIDQMQVTKQDLIEIKRFIEEICLE